MWSDETWLETVALTDSIDRQPLVVAPETPLLVVVELMSQTRGDRCSLSDNTTPTMSHLRGARSSCVLIMRDQALLGIFTERDIVKLTANEIDFTLMTIADVMTHPVVTLSEAAFQDIFAALFLFRRYRIRHLVIVSDTQQVVGIVSPESIRQVLRPTNLLKLRRVGEVMSSDVIHAPLTTSVLELTQLMAIHQVSCIVIAETDTWEDRLHTIVPVGIVTERDVVQFRALGLALGSLEAHVVMSSPLFLLHPDDSLWVAHQEMQRRRVQRLVVSWDWNARLGIVTQSSLLRIFDPIEMYGVIDTLQQTIEQLKDANSQGQPESVLSDSVVSTPAVMPIDDRMFRTIAQTSLARLQSKIQQLHDHPELSDSQRQSGLASALSELDHLQQLFNSIVQPSQGYE